ncbi:MAG: hypothetical protein E6656_05450 [Streptococcus sp.]|uniref:hypothetical protein n=1 Tax=Streptococcus sp. TaxID=1306 RepID=UPI002914A71D|nr:hypothetical protein [Streptococcus sp.]MDU6118980.1 hypothetical protein [Streptococcus sp.]
MLAVRDDLTKDSKSENLILSSTYLELFGAKETVFKNKYALNLFQFMYIQSISEYKLEIIGTIPRKQVRLTTFGEVTTE